jgi:hypothetical protein
MWLFSCKDTEKLSFGMADGPENFRSCQGSQMLKKKDEIFFTLNLDI